MSPRATCPIRRSSGVESWKAVWTPTARVRCPRAARDETDARPAGELAVRVRHVGGADLVPRRDVPDRRVDERVEHREIALARHAEREVDAVDLELVDENPPATAAHAQRAVEEHRRPLQLRFLVVGRDRDTGSSACLPTPRGGRSTRTNAVGSDAEAVASTG